MSGERFGRSIGQGWFVTSIAPKLPGHELWLRGPGQARIMLEPGVSQCFRRVGDVGVSYRGAEAPASESAANAVADWLESTNLPWVEALRQLVPTPLELGADPSAWTRLVAASPLGTGFATPGDQASRPGAFARWRNAAKVCGRREGFLADLPVCFGGRPSVRGSEDPRCRGCVDAGSCVGPFVGSEVDRLRPSPNRQAEDQLVGAIEAIGHGVQLAVAPLRILLDHIADGPYDIFELSYTIARERISRGPRVTCYLPADRRDVAARGFVALAGTSDAQRIVERLAPVSENLPWHVGFDPGPDGLSSKLYISIESLRDPGDRFALLHACGPLQGVEQVARWPIQVLGVTLRPSGETRVRVYPRVPRAEVTDDVTADPYGSVGCTLSPTEDPVQETRYAHYFDSQLVWPEVAERLTLEPTLAEGLGRGFAPPRCRYYFTQLGYGPAGVTVYTQVGPHPRDL